MGAPITPEERKEKDRQRWRRYDAEHRDEKRARDRRRYAATADAQRARHRAYYAANRDAQRERCRAYHSEHRDQIIAKDIEYRDTNRAELNAKARAAYRADLQASREKARRFNKKYQARNRAWYWANKTRVAVTAAAWVQANRHKVAAKVARRRAAKLRATPAWSDLSQIQSIYAQAADLTSHTGVVHEVDHIIPLQNALVCGLHVPCNLRVITRTLNRRKRNALLDKVA